MKTFWNLLLQNFMKIYVQKYMFICGKLFAQKTELENFAKLVILNKHSVMESLRKLCGSNHWLLTLLVMISSVTSKYALVDSFVTYYVK